MFRQAGIGALAFDADDLHQPAIGGELHELLMILVGGQARRNRRKAARPGSLVKNTDNWHPKKGGGRREPPRPKALCKKFRQVAQAAVAPDDGAPPCVTFFHAAELTSCSGRPVSERWPLTPMVCTSRPSVVNFMNC